MQKKLLPLVLLLASSSTIAQPIITSAINPQNGDVFTYYTCDSVGPGVSGANVTWQFGNLNDVSNATGTYESCPGALDCSLFSGSNIALVSGTSSGAYYIADANRYAWNGERVNTVTTFVYSDPRDTRRYPFSMGDSYTDTHKCTFTSGSDFTRKGSISVEADGYGTLILPTGTFSNVLRVHSVDEYNDSNHLSPLLDQGYVRDVYEWYQEGYHDFLLHVEIFYTLPGSFLPDTFTHGTVSYTIAGPNNVASIAGEEGTKIYPVPAHDNINIELTSDAQSIEMTDIVGKSVATAACVKGQLKYDLNTSNLPSGIYFIRIKTKERMMTRKIEVQ